MKNKFVIKGNDGSLHIEICKVFGFPKMTSYTGGYETESKIIVKNENYEFKSTLYISTGEIYSFHQELKKCYQECSGIANLITRDRDFDLSVSFDRLGHTKTYGFFRPSMDGQNNQLDFELNGDQSYIPEALLDLEVIQNEYGDNLGVKY